MLFQLRFEKSATTSGAHSSSGCPHIIHGQAISSSELFRVSQANRSTITIAKHAGTGVCKLGMQYVFHGLGIDFDMHLWKGA